MQEYLPGLKKNVPLKNYTSFKIGGKARYFFAVKSENDLIKATSAATKNGLPFFVLGGGTNLLVSDKDFKGLVIKIQNTRYKIQNTKITVEAGTPLAEIVAVATKNGLTGLEWASGIPGTVGGAIYGNAKVFDHEMGNIVKSALVLDSQNGIQDGKIKKFSKKDCEFDYKTSIFKKKKNLIIVSAELELSNSDRKEIKGKVKNNLDYRKKAQPQMLPSAGSIFINPRVKITDKKLLKQFPKLIDFNKRGFIPAGFLIDSCNLRGKCSGKAKISEKHANFIVNSGGAAAKDVVKLISLIKRKVKNKFYIDLEVEVQMLQ